MGFFEKARTFFEASGMVTLEFVELAGSQPSESVLALTATEVTARYRVTALRDCVVVRHIARVCSRLPSHDGMLGTVIAESIHDAGSREGVLSFPYTLRAGQTVEDSVRIASVDLPAQLRRYRLEGLDPRVEFFVRVVIDVQGSPFDPEFEVRLDVRS
jgi:hypothetical protein